MTTSLWQTDDFFLLSSLQGLINLISGMKCIVAMSAGRQRIWEESWFWLDLLTAAVVLVSRLLSCGLWTLLQRPNCTSDAERCFCSALTQRKLAQERPKRPFRESIKLPAPAVRFSNLNCEDRMLLDVGACVPICVCVRTSNFACRFWGSHVSLDV